MGPPKEDDRGPLGMQSSLGEAKSDEGAIRGRFLVSLLQRNREGWGLKAAKAEKLKKWDTYAAYVKLGNDIPCLKHLQQYEPWTELAQLNLR